MLSPIWLSVICSNYLCLMPHQTYETCMQDSPENDLERKQSHGNWTLTFFQWTVHTKQKKKKVQLYTHFGLVQIAHYITSLLCGASRVVPVALPLLWHKLTQHFTHTCLLCCFDSNGTWYQRAWWLGCKKSVKLSVLYFYDKNNKERTGWNLEKIRTHKELHSFAYAQVPWAYEVEKGRKHFRYSI